MSKEKAEKDRKQVKQKKAGKSRKEKCDVCQKTVTPADGYMSMGMVIKDGLPAGMKVCYLHNDCTPKDGRTTMPGAMKPGPNSRCGCPACKLLDAIESGLERKISELDHKLEAMGVKGAN